MPNIPTEASYESDSWAMRMSVMRIPGNSPASSQEANDRGTETAAPLDERRLDSARLPTEGDAVSPCDPLVQGDRIVGYLCTSHQKLFRTDETVDRWCFACRKRLPHTWELWGDPGPSYYEPEWVCRCSGCGKDRTRFGDGA